MSLSGPSARKPLGQLAVNRALQNVLPSTPMQVYSEKETEGISQHFFLVKKYVLTRKPVRKQEPLWLYWIYSPSPAELKGQAVLTEHISSETNVQGAPGFALFPQLAPGLQMHRPRQGCASLGCTERLLCSGSFSPDALIETLRRCRNQREGRREHERGCKHIWHLQKPAHDLSYHPGMNLQALQKKSSSCLAGRWCTQRVNMNLVYIR